MPGCCHEKKRLALCMLFLRCRIIGAKDMLPVQFIKASFAFGNVGMLTLHLISLRKIGLPTVYVKA
ncbi:hypothetical protein B0X71_02825 [Planococcus lenghuensis]|uniref:Uncharacterized protein n=1 Tax=Planococcus lenghuensis TaxID=2213202 RepID=A0A1Q2KWU8_9BACL|nr:hypothetical protein B0X71_02825 [Planococcus lenghuensis]